MLFQILRMFGNEPPKLFLCCGSTQWPNSTNYFTFEPAECLSSPIYGVAPINLLEDQPIDIRSGKGLGSPPSCQCPKTRKYQQSAHELRPLAP